MDKHIAYLKTICRICSENIASSRLYNLEAVSHIVQEAFKDCDGGDITKDSEYTHSQVLCNRCYMMLKKWDQKHQKHLLYMRKNPKAVQSFSPAVKLPESIENVVVHREGCVCEGLDLGQAEESSALGQELAPPDHHQEAGTPSKDSERHEEGCTPSKVQRLSRTPVESPSDKRTAREMKSNTPAVKSIKFSFSKPVTEGQDAEVLAMTPPSVKKVYVSKDSFAAERLEDPNVGKFFLCRVCGNLPKLAKVNAKCMHFYCETCIDNFQMKVPTSKCPAVSPEGDICKFPTSELYKIDGLLNDIHSSIGLSCLNSACDEYILLRDIDEHEENCRKRGPKRRKQESLSKTRSKLLHMGVEMQMKILTDWCQKHKVNPSDFLLFALTKSIRKEVPSLEKSVQELFKNYLEVKEAGSKEVITPIMALALKLEINLSHRQYCKLSSKKLLGKLPYIAQVRKVADQLDPGNVLYEKLLRSTGEVISHHGAVLKGGILNASDDIGHMSFGDLNINVHGYRATLTDSVAKLFEEIYPEVAVELQKNTTAAEDPERRMKLFVKVAFDGTSAPVKSEKASSRVPPGSWLRGTLCLVTVQVNKKYFKSSSMQIFKTFHAKM